MCFVRLHSDNPVLKCQENKSFLNWHDKNHFDKNLVKNLWEPEATMFIHKFDEYMNAIRNKFELFQNHLSNATSETFHSKINQIDINLLKSLNISEKDIHLFFIQFIENCFPSVYMTFYSFKHFLNNLGLKMSVRLMKVIFITKREDHMSFEELLMALICLDPHCPLINRRLSLIFDYYDIRRNGYLDGEELRQILTDIDRNESKEVIDGMVAEYIALKDLSSEGLIYYDMKKEEFSGTIEGTDRLFRLKFPLFRRIGCGRKRVGPNVLNEVNTFPVNST